MALGHHREVHKADHCRRDKRRVNQVRSKRFHEMCLWGTRLQVELAGEGGIHLGNRYEKANCKANDKAQGETFQETDDN